MWKEWNDGKYYDNKDGMLGYICQRSGTWSFIGACNRITWDVILAASSKMSTTREKGTSRREFPVQLISTSGDDIQMYTDGVMVRDIS